MVMMIGSTTVFVLLALLATPSKAFQAANSLVASSPFELYLQPTFVELNLQSQTIAAQAVGGVLASVTSNLQDFDVVIQNVVHRPQRRRLNSNLNLPSTTLTFAVLGTFPNDMSGQRDYLNTLIQDTLSSNAGQASLLQSLKTSHEHFKDLINIRVSSPNALTTTAESDNTEGFLENLSVVDIVLVAVSVCVLLGVTYMVIVSHRANRREHRRVLQLLSNHEAAANSLRELEQEESASISSRLQLIKSNMRRSSSMTIAPLDKPTEEEEATDDEDRGGSTTKEETEQEQDAQANDDIEAIEPVEQVPSIPSQKSSSSYHSAAELLAASKGSMRSEGVLSDEDVIPSPQSSSDEDDDENYSESASGYSSGISSAHFSSSRWFQGKNNVAAAPSEDTFDVFAIDVEKYDDKLLLDDGSKTSATENFLEEWVKAIQVVPGEKSSIATKGSAGSTGSVSTPECASVQSGGSKEASDKDAKSVTHQATPEKDQTVLTTESTPEVEV